MNLAMAHRRGTGGRGLRDGAGAPGAQSRRADRPDRLLGFPGHRRLAYPHADGSQRRLLQHPAQRRRAEEWATPGTPPKISPRASNA